MLFLIFGIALIVGPALLRSLRSQRENRLADLLSRDLRTRPSGPDGTFTRRDHLMGALRAVGAGAACIGIAVLISVGVNDAVPSFWLALEFIAFVGVMMSAVMVLVALVRAAIGWNGPLPQHLRAPAPALDGDDGERRPKLPYIPAE